MSGFRIGVTLASVVAGGLAAAASAAAPAPIKMYRDESRCMQLGIPVWNHVHIRDGLFQTRVMDLIESDRLCKYDVIVINNQIESIAYSPSELKALDEFVRRGGGLLLVGNPSPHIERPARFRKGRLVDTPQPLPVQQFSSNQVANLFGAAFTNAMRPGAPEFNKTDALLAGANLGKLTFRQPLDCLLCNGMFRPLVAAGEYPVVAAIQYNKGRVIVCGAPRLLAVYGSLSERKLGETDEVIDAQKQLLIQWLEWLAAGSPVRDQSHEGYPDSVPGSVRLTGNEIEIYTIPPLRAKAEQLLGDWSKVWPVVARYLDVQSPLEFVGAEPGEKLEVYLRASPAGGLSGGECVSIPAMGGDERLIAVLGHEVGHKLLGGCNSSVSEAFAEWMGAHALMAAGQDGAARAKIENHIADFRARDPSGSALDIADERTDITQSKACQGKWIWILAELTKRHGDGLMSRYVRALRVDVHLAGAGRKVVDGRKEHLSMADHVQALSEAAGEDLTPWFRDLGITVSTASRAKPRQ